MAKKKNIREKMYGFYSDKEFCIYKNLCTSDEPKKSDMEKTLGIYFTTYAEWKQYVRMKYAESPLDGLREFKRYLNNRKRLSGVINNWWNIFLVPFLITVLGTFIMGSLKEIPAFQIINLKEVLHTFPQADCSEKLLALLLIFISILLASSPTIIIMVGLFVFMRKMLNTSMENEQEAAFYDDYIEIIAEIINEKETATINIVSTIEQKENTRG